MTKWFNVGKIVNTHGVKGEVRVISITDFAEERYKKGNKLFLFNKKGEQVELVVKSYRTHKQFDLLSFEGYNNLNEVEHMKGSTLKVKKEQLSELHKDEYYFHEIIGCTVYDLENNEIGIIKEILTPGANDVWVVKQVSGTDAYIPYFDEIVKEVDVDNKKVSIQLMDGLLS